jgi:hypothetical protein
VNPLPAGMSGTTLYLLLAVFAGILPSHLEPDKSIEDCLLHYRTPNRRPHPSASAKSCLQDESLLRAAPPSVRAGPSHLTRNEPLRIGMLGCRLLARENFAVNGGTQP